MLQINIRERRPIWIALADFYLDHELQDFEFKHVASKIKESPYTLDEVKLINQKEVFPVLHSNLLNTAGVWSSFQKEWLVKEITERLQKRTRFVHLIISIKYVRLKGMYADYWEKLEGAYREL